MSLLDVCVQAGFCQIRSHIIDSGLIPEYIPVYTGVYLYILVHTCVYWCIPVYTLSKLVCTSVHLVLSNIMFNSFYRLDLFVYTCNPVYTKVVQESRS